MNQPFEDFCDQVCKPIRWPPAQRLAREELTAHLEDHAAALEAQGVPPEDAALVYAPEYMGLPSHLELQVALSTSHWQLWLDDLDLYEVPCTWIDSTGATGTASCYSWENSPLTGTGYLKIQTPTPGAQWFTVTLGRPGDQIMLRIDLEEEVPAS